MEKVESTVEKMTAELKRLTEDEFKEISRFIKQEEKDRRTRKAKETRKRNMKKKEAEKVEDDLDDIIGDLEKTEGLRTKRRVSQRKRTKRVLHNVPKEVKKSKPKKASLKRARNNSPYLSKLFGTLSLKTTSSVSPQKKRTKQVSKPRRKAKLIPGLDDDL